MQSEAVGGSTICLHATKTEQHWPFWASLLCSEARPFHRPNRPSSVACSTDVAQEGRTKRAIYNFRTPSDIKGPVVACVGEKTMRLRASAAGLVAGSARTGKRETHAWPTIRAPGRRSNGWMPVVRGGFPARLDYSLEE